MKGKLKRGKSAIYNALLKYDHSKFKLVILAYCEKKETLKLEQKFINILKPEYNLCKIAGSSLGRIITISSRQKMRAAQLARAFRKPLKDTNETFFEFKANRLLKMLEKIEIKTNKLEKSLQRTIKDRLKRRVSAETRAKILKGTLTSISVKVTDLETGVKTRYASARSATVSLNMSNSTVMNKIKNKSLKPYKNRFVFKSCTH